MASWFIYACIAGGGFLFLLVSLVLGGDGDHDGDGGGHFHPDGVEVAGDGASHTLDALGSWFSLKVIAAFCVGFGGAGATASMLNPNPLVAVGSATGFGLLMAAVARWIVGLFIKNETSSHVSEQSLLGQEGVVTQTILAGRAGEVEVKGVYRPARAAEGVEIKTGEHVRVLQMGATLTVEPAAKSAGTGS